MAGRGKGADFVESLARGLDVLACFDATRRELSLSEVAAATGLARPTARRLLLTLQELGYARTTGQGGFALTPQVLRLGIAYASPLGLWDMARPHMETLVARTHARVVLDHPARRFGHRVRRAGVGPEDHHSAGRHRDQVPGRADVAGQGAPRATRR
ncbi:helix-turn-helix domain-containing protein [Streptomyces sp. NPDC059582]|uniref:helix-turn-helix domain-containing protein n=1 Tax=Streptomyces sp. NPDC059582 TaxID=3346875 RepID=UPI0036BF7609